MVVGNARAQVVNVGLVNGYNQSVDEAVERNTKFLRDVFLFTARCSFSTELVVIV
jgi:hypothetical protein